MRGLFFRKRGFRAVVLVTGGWILTAFLFVMIIEQNSYAQSNYIIHKETREFTGKKEEKCNCTCSNVSRDDEAEHTQSPGGSTPHQTLENNENTLDKINVKNNSNYVRSTQHEVMISPDRSLHHRKSNINKFPQPNGDRDSNTDTFVARRSMIGQNLTNGVPHHFVQPNNNSRIWPLLGERDDRIPAQINVLPHTENNIKKIALMGRFHGVERGKSQFLKDACPVNSCEIMGKHNYRKADVVIYNNELGHMPRRDSIDQILVWYMLESPVNGPRLPANTFNWTATYRQDSTITAPYERFTLYNNVTELPRSRKNYASGKSKMAAWFVSNCHPDNGRQKYAGELKKYIDVDIFGACGDKKCPRNAGHCQNMLTRDYRFYLAFENSNCLDYITEKFFWNGLLNDVIPIVMGARPEDYRRVAPPHSYIHVDDFETPRDLAEYLVQLSEDDEKYNAYFRWKGTGAFLNTKFWCRLCAMAHEATITNTRMYYNDFQKWWHGEGVCLKANNTTGWASWRTQPREYTYMDSDTLHVIT